MDAHTFKYVDITVEVKKHKRRSDVMTVWEAAASKKSSKNHKMKPRSSRLDRTKTKESRIRTVQRNQDRL